MATSPSILRPLTLGELLDRTFTLYRRRIWLFVGILLVPILITVVLNVGLQSVMPGKLFVWPPSANPDPVPMASIFRLYSYAVPVFLIALMLFGVAFAACAIAVAELSQGSSLTILECFRRISGKYGSVIGLALLLVVIGFVATMIAVIVGAFAAGLLIMINPILGAVGMILAMLGAFALGIWVLMNFATSIPVMVLERKGVFASLGRSAVLSRGFRGRIFISMLLPLLISWAVGLAFQTPFLVLGARSMMKVGEFPLYLRVGSAVMNGLGHVLTAPLAMIAVSLLYLDFRVRKEALDLEVMLSRVAAPGEPGAAPPPPPLAG